MTNDDEITVGVLKFKTIKAKPGAASLYIGAEQFSKIDIPLDTDLVMKFNKKTKEVCLKLLEY